MGMRQKIQIGIEGFKKGSRVLRLTPVDFSADIPAQVALVVGAAESLLDTRDAQPGDGEIDVEIPIERAIKMFPWAKAQIDGRVDKVNLFINFK